MKKLVVLFAAITAGICSQPACAEVETLDPIVVTATRTSTPLSQVGSSITLITRDEIEAKQQPQVLDILRSVPGVTVVQSGPMGGQTSIHIRGTDNRHTLILIDGVEFRDASLIGGDSNLANINTDNIERIEIVRGPQSVIYGSDAIGGVINIITRKGTEGVHGYASVEGGSYNTWTETAGVNGGSDNVKASFAVSNTESDGFSYYSEKDGFTEKDGYSNKSISMNISSEMSKSFTLNLTLNRTEAENEFDGYDNSYMPADTDIKTKSDETIAHAEGVLLSFSDKLKTTAGVSVTEIDRKTSGSGLYDNYEYQGSVTKLDLKNILTLSQNQTFVLGIETEKEEYKSTYGQGDARNNAGYLQDQLSIGDFSTALGVRIDDHSTFGNETTWRVAPTYNLSSTNTRFLASIGTGFKAPSLFQLSYNHDLNPEKSLGFDIGLEQPLFNKTVVLNVSWFKNDIEDYIDWSGGWNGNYSNVKKLKTKGIESSIGWYPAAFVDVTLGYTYTDTEDENGDNKARIPLHKVTGDMNLYPTEALQLNVNVIYVGKRDDGTTAEILGEYTLVNLAMSYQFSDNLKLFGRVDNLFDEDYEEAAGYGTAGLSGYAGLKVSF